MKIDCNDLIKVTRFAWFACRASSLSTLIFTFTFVFLSPLFKTFILLQAKDKKALELIFLKPKCTKHYFHPIKIFQYS